MQLRTILRSHTLPFLGASPNVSRFVDRGELHHWCAFDRESSRAVEVRHLKLICPARSAPVISISIPRLAGLTPTECVWEGERSRMACRKSPQTAANRSGRCAARQARISKRTTGRVRADEMLARGRGSLLSAPSEAFLAGIGTRANELRRVVRVRCPWVPDTTHALLD